MQTWFPISRSISASRRRTDELGSRLERPIHFECKLNGPMHIGMWLLHPAAADHSVTISRQQVQHIFSFSLRSRAVLIVLLQTYPKAVPSKSLVLVDGDSAVVVSLVEWVAHIRLHYPLLCCSDHLPCALQHAKRGKSSLKELYGTQKKDASFQRCPSARAFLDAVVTWRRWWSRSLPLVSGHWTRWGGFCGRVMPPLRRDDRRGADDRYAIQFAQRPPKYRGIHFTAVKAADAPILRAEIAVLLAKDAIEPVPPADMRSGFYSPYFIVPKKGGGLRPILDLRV